LKAEALFLASLPVIDAAVSQVCRRHYLQAAEADEFASEVRLHFIEKNYEPLRQFRGQASLRTYLGVVVNHLFLDYRNRLWGKWRPSAEARRQGSVAILVERYVTRDGWTLDQAIEIVRVNHRAEVTDADCASFATLTQRAPSRQFVPEMEADELESLAPPPDANVLRAEQDFLAKRVQTALERVRQTLDPLEQLILRMRFEDGVPVADIARAHHLNQKRLYRTIEQLLARLRQGLEAEGIDREEIRALFADGAFAASESNGAPERAGAAGAPHPAERARRSWLRS
jgi:RNA polymerase sigma factor for flagellar operon FliA